MAFSVQSDAPAFAICRIASALRHVLKSRQTERPTLQLCSIDEPQVQRTSISACVYSGSGATQNSGLNSQGAAPRGAPAQSAEEVVSRSGLDAAAVAGFLFENYAEYVDGSAMDDVASAAAALSDAMHMIQRRTDDGSSAFVVVQAHVGCLS
jgi:hypothetical protein